MSFQNSTLAFCLQVLVNKFPPNPEMSVSPIRGLNGGCRVSVGTSYPLDHQIYGFLPLPHTESIAVLSDST